MSAYNKFKEFYTELSSGIAWCMFCSFAAIVMSIIALAKCAPSSQLHADYIGVIVGILTLLVTVLVGWQVYTLIEIKSVLRRVNRAERNLKKSESRIKTQIYRHIYKESANTSMLHVFSFISNIDVLDREHFVEIRMAYGASAQTLLYQLLSNEKTYIDECLNVMILGVQFASRHNIWEDFFDATTTEVLNNAFIKILPISAGLSQEQKNTLLHIHDSRTSRQLHDTLRPATQTATS